MLLQYTLRRLISIIPVILIVSVIVFLIVHLTPGNPAYLILGEDSSPEAIAQLESQLGLDQSIFMQFFDWFKRVLVGDLGESIYSSQPVTEVIIERVGPTFSLMVLSIIFTLIIAIPVAVFVVWCRHTILEDRKSTRLNSSHVAISYAVFCLQKK